MVQIGGAHAVINGSGRHFKVRVRQADAIRGLTLNNGGRRCRSIAKDHVLTLKPLQVTLEKPLPTEIQEILRRYNVHNLSKPKTTPN